MVRTWGAIEVMLHRRMVVTCASGVALFLTAGCARINPGPDFDHVSTAIQERTGSAQVYAPAAERTGADRVAALLADGLGVEEAAEIALLNNPSFQSLFEEIGISRAEVVQSGLLKNPIVSTLIKFPEGGGRVSWDLGVSQEIADLWQIPVRRKIAKAKLGQTMAAVTQRAVEVVAEAKTSYYRLRARQMEEETIAASVRIVEESTAVVDRQVKNGAASPLDLNLTRAASMDVHLELLAVRRQREAATIELGRTLGLDPRLYPKQLTDSLPQDGNIAEIRQLVECAMTQRLDLRRMQQELAAAEDEVIRQSLLVIPSVMAGMGMERPERQSPPGRNILADTARSSIQNGGLTAPDIQSRAQRALDRRQFIDFLIGPSFQATIPVFDQNQAQIAIAAARVRQRRKDLRELTIRAQSEIEQSLSALKTSREQVDFYTREAIPIAEANEAGSRSLFMAGAQNILVLLEAQRSLIGRRRAHVVVLGDAANALVELERVVGGRLPCVTSTTLPAEDRHE